MGDRGLSVGRTLRWTRGQLFEWSGLNRLARERLDGRSAAVLMYHRVLPETEAQRLAVEPAMYVTPEAFELQMGALEAAGFRIVSLAEITRAFGENAALPKQAVALTFDDGWRDNYQFAAPILARFDYPATTFVVTDRVGSQGAFWPDEVARRLANLPAPVGARLFEDISGRRHQGELLDDMLGTLKAQTPGEREDALARIREQTPAPPTTDRELMTWPELDELAGAGWAIESHGVSHALLDELDAAGLEAELGGALDALRSHGHGKHGHLAYPSGRFNDRVINATQAAGYSLAVSTEHGVAKFGSNPFAIPRLGIHQDISGTRAEFLQKVPGW